ncbi:MAG: hypothetical protein IPJ06_09860 [Saprospiraceae bacterium]|nr:hypothetical protein [Saprospiraceae bacterium]
MGRLGLLVFLLLSFARSIGQNCDAIIVEDRMVQNTQYLRSENIPLVIRSNFTYSLELVNREKGIMAKVSSKGGEILNKDDEVIFWDLNQVRHAFRFVEMGQRSTGQMNTYENVLLLDLEAIQWLASTYIDKIYIKKFVSHKIYRYLLNENRREELRQMATCFLQRLDKSKVNQDMVASKAPDPVKKEDGGTTEAPASSKPKSAPASEDAEVKALTNELQSVRAGLKTEIEDERKRADQAKYQIQDDVRRSRELAEAKKAEIAQEVLTARKNADAEIANIQAELAAQVKAAREKAGEQLQLIQFNVEDSRTQAAKEVQESRLAAAREVAAARKEAAARVEEIEKSLELTRLEYADEIASARESSVAELDLIRAETAAAIKLAEGNGQHTAESVG